MICQEKNVLQEDKNFFRCLLRLGIQKLLLREDIAAGCRSHWLIVMRIRFKSESCNPEMSAIVCHR